MPKWTAVLYLTGFVLNYGMEAYKNTLDIKLKQLEFQEKTRVELKSKADRLNEITSGDQNSTAAAIQQNIYLYRSQIYQTNIKEVRLNDETVYTKP